MRIIHVDIISKKTTLLLSTLSLNSFLFMPVSSLNTPAQNFDLHVWKLQLPVNSNNKFSGSPAEIYPITSTYADSPYFSSGSDGAMVFYAPYNGITTTNSIHPRSELRELSSPGMSAAGYWDVTTQHTSLSAILAVNQLAMLKSGSTATVVISQIHAPSGELVRLYYPSNGALYWESSPPSGTSCPVLNGNYLYSSQGIKSSIPLNAQFSYNIQTNTTHLLVFASYGGVIYSAWTRLQSCWSGANAGMYYKAGCYCQVNNNPSSSYYGTGACQVSFYALPSPIESSTTLGAGARFPASASVGSTASPVSGQSSLLPSGAPHSAPITSTPSSRPSAIPSVHPTGIPFTTHLPSLTPSSSLVGIRPSVKPATVKPSSPTFIPTSKPISYISSSNPVSIAPVLAPGPGTSTLNPSVIPISVPSSIAITSLSPLSHPPLSPPVVVFVASTTVPTGKPSIKPQAAVGALVTPNDSNSTGAYSVTVFVSCGIASFLLVLGLFILCAYKRHTQTSDKCCGIFSDKSTVAYPISDSNELSFCDIDKSDTRKLFVSGSGIHDGFDKDKANGKVPSLRMGAIYTSTETFTGKISARFPAMMASALSKFSPRPIITSPSGKRVDEEADLEQVEPLMSGRDVMLDRGGGGTRSESIAFPVAPTFISPRARRHTVPQL